MGPYTKKEMVQLFLQLEDFKYVRIGLRDPHTELAGGIQDFFLKKEKFHSYAVIKHRRATKDKNAPYPMSVFHTAKEIREEIHKKSRCKLSRFYKDRVCKLRDMLYHTSVKDMPLFLEEESPFLVIVSWRLNLGK